MPESGDMQRVRVVVALAGGETCCLEPLWVRTSEGQCIFVHSTTIMHERPTARHRHRAGKRHPTRCELAELQNWAGQGGWPAAPLHISGEVGNRCPAAKGLVDTRGWGGVILPPGIGAGGGDGGCALACSSTRAAEKREIEAMRAGDKLGWRTAWSH